MVRGASSSSSRPDRLYTVDDGTWRSLVARSLWEREVASSNLAVPIIVMRALVAIVAVVMIGSAAGCAGGDGTSEPGTPFAYDRAAPLAYVDRGVVNKGYPVAVHDVAYSTPAGNRIDAMLVVPPAVGPV